MSSQIKVCLLYLPGAWNDVWMEALRSAALAAEWDFLDACGPTSAVRADANTLIVSFDLNAARLLEPDHWCILHASPESVLSYLTDIRGQAQTELQNLWEASHRLAAAAQVSALPATVLNAECDVIDVPYLGEVKRGAEITRASFAGEGAKVLNIYRSLPIPVGAKFFIPVEMWVAGDGKLPSHDWIDLTGRGRLVFGLSPFDMPAGAWRAEILFSLEIEGTAVPLRAEWGGVGDRTAGVFRGEKSGRYSFSIDHYLERASTTTGQLLLSYPVFQGRMRLYGGVVIKLESMQSVRT